MQWLFNHSHRGSDWLGDENGVGGIASAMLVDDSPFPGQFDN